MNKRKINTFPLKIAVLGHKTIPSRQGGIEIVVEELTVRMAKLGHKITVYNRNGHHVSGKEFDEKKLKEYKGIRMKYVPTIEDIQPFLPTAPVRQQTQLSQTLQ